MNNSTNREKTTDLHLKRRRYLRIVRARDHRAGHLCIQIRCHLSLQESLRLGQSVLDYERRRGLLDGLEQQTHYFCQHQGTHAHILRELKGDCA